MSFDVEEYVCYQVANAPLASYPFPHFYVRPVFPEDFYRRMLENLPDTEALTPINEFGTVGNFDADGMRVKSRFEPRYLADLEMLEVEEAAGRRGDTWRSLRSWLPRSRFRDLVVRKFGAGLVKRFGSDFALETEVEVRFVRDFTDYSIEPHTDVPEKLVSLLFYLPRDDSLRHLGTSLYVPKDPALRCDGRARHSFDQFRKVFTAGFLPNALLGFLKSDQAFHGVELIKDQAIERNVLLYNIYVRGVTQEGAAQPGAAVAA
jgi:hypothetical protein